MHMTERRDLRVVKTRKALISTMLMMLNEMPFAKITVHEICARALVSRSAFYAHFQDKYELAAKSLEALSQQIFTTAENQDRRGHLLNLLENIQKDSRLFKNLLLADYDGELMEVLRKGFLLKFSQHPPVAEQGSCFPEPREVAASFLAAGFTGAVMLWIRNNLPYTPQQMCECIFALMPTM